ncbi:MAG: hypothetical protein QF535_12125, partial [Anaerolineales bacterium]|nr:hypothetical protein [Anaerolineales bacterium]
MFSQTVYSSEFLRKASRSVNRLMIGTGSFSGILFAATDIGLFWSKIDEGFEANWFYVMKMNMPIADMIITNDDTLSVATEQGIYYSTDVIDWTYEDNPAIQYPIQRLQLRWNGRETIEVGSHRATFSNDNYTNPLIGYINNDSRLYGQLSVGRIIRVTGAGGLNGDYSVKDVTPSRITISKAFDGLTEAVSYNGVELAQAAWWETFSDGEYTGSGDITNTIVAGGNKSISYKVGDAGWNQAEVPSDYPNFFINDMLSLNMGVLISCAQGYNDEGQNNYIFKSTTLGGNWDLLFDLPQIGGVIVASKPNDYGNTELTVDYFNSEYRYVDGNLDLKTIAISNESSVVSKSFIVWNYFLDGTHRIVVKGQNVHDAYLNNRDQALTFSALPANPKVAFESEDSKVLVGTDEGIYTDKGSTYGSALEFGDIVRLGT